MVYTSCLFVIILIDPFPLSSCCHFVDCTAIMTSTNSLSIEKLWYITFLCIGNIFFPLKQKRINTWFIGYNLMMTEDILISRNLTGIFLSTKLAVFF